MSVHPVIGRLRPCYQPALYRAYRGKNAGDQRIAFVKPGCITMGLTDIRPGSTADYAESYSSFWSIRCFWHSIISELGEQEEGRAVFTPAPGDLT